MFFIIALLNGILTSRVRRQEMRIRVREERTDALYQLTKELAADTNFDEVTQTALKYIQKYFNLDCAILLKDELGSLDETVHHQTKVILKGTDMAIAIWVHKHVAIAGKHTDTLPSSDFTFYPLKGNIDNMGVIAVEHTSLFTQGEEQFWDALISQISNKYEREFLRNETRKTYLISESEKLYKTLFNSISHELRIPIATVMGASDTLLSENYPEDTKVKLYTEINRASIRLNRLIENLLNMSRLETGRIKAHLDWCDVHDLANKVAETLQQELKPFVFEIIIPEDMPMVKIDFGLIEQALHNLILNATQNVPTGTTIQLKLFCDNALLFIQVLDRGKGFTKIELLSLFNKFYRGHDAIAGGTGLGLSIVKGFVEAHKGTVIAENRPDGGAVFTMKIPVEVITSIDEK